MIRGFRGLGNELGLLSVHTSDRTISYGQTAASMPLSARVKCAVESGLSDSRFRSLGI